MNAPKNTSQDYDRKHKKDHVSNNPRADKDALKEDDFPTKADRKEVRQENTAHFTNRQSNKQ